MKIQFASLGEVQEFVGLATLQPYAIHVQDAKHTVNAKSFMEMFTLDFSAPLDVVVSSEHENRFALAAKKFIV